MKELNLIFAENLIFLRKRACLTQLELSEKLNYSDKAVSKWERGEAIPDVSVLMKIGSIFGVTVDYLVSEHAEDEKPEERGDAKVKRGLLVTLITFLAFIFAETVVYLSVTGSVSDKDVFLFCFIYPLPVWAVTGIVFSSLWGNKLSRFISVAMLVAFLTLDAFLIVALISGARFYLIFVVLAPAELIVYLSFYLSGGLVGKRSKKAENN